MTSNKVKTTKRPIELHIGKRLRQRRLEQGLTLQDVDKLLGSPAGTTKAFEQGKRFVGPGDLFTLSSLLDVDVSFFFLNAGTGVRNADSLAHTPDVVKGAQRLVQAYYNIEDQHLRQSIVDLLINIADDESV